jgi:hypothetical protein
MRCFTIYFDKNIKNPQVIFRTVCIPSSNMLSNVIISVILIILYIGVQGGGAISMKTNCNADASGAAGGENHV